MEVRGPLRIEGEPAQLPASVDLSADRIVQEALTTTLKHVGSQMRVTGSGHGLIGMRERVALYGGVLETGNRNGHGFAVRARLPIVAAGTTVGSPSAEAAGEPYPG